MKGKVKLRIFVGWLRGIFGVVICAMLIALIVSFAILLAKDGDIKELKVIAPIAIALCTLLLPYCILHFSSNVVILEDGFKFFGFEFIGDGISEMISKKNNGKYRRVKYGMFLKFEDIDSLYVVIDDDIPFTLPKKYLIINMKSGAPYRLPLSDFSKLSVEKIKQSIIANSGCLYK